MADEKKTAPTPLDHPGRPVFVLVPTDKHEQMPCLTLVEDLQRKCKDRPLVRTNIVPGRISHDSIIYVCHPVTERQKDAAGYYNDVDVAYLSEPIVLRNFIAAGNGEDVLALVNFPALCEAITAACKVQRSGRVYYAQGSGEKEISAKSIRLGV